MNDAQMQARAKLAAMHKELKSWQKVGEALANPSDNAASLGVTCSQIATGKRRATIKMLKRLDLYTPRRRFSADVESNETCKRFDDVAEKIGLSRSQLIAGIASGEVLVIAGD